MSRILSQTQTILKNLVTAGRKTAGFLSPLRAVPPKIAVMNVKGEITHVYVLHYIDNLLVVPAVIGHVADQREFEPGALNPLNGGAARKKKHEVRNNQGGLQHRQRTYFRRADFCVSHVMPPVHLPNSGI